MSTPDDDRTETELETETELDRTVEQEPVEAAAEAPEAEPEPAPAVGAGAASDRATTDVRTLVTAGIMATALFLAFFAGLLVGSHWSGPDQRHDGPTRAMHRGDGATAMRPGVRQYGERRFDRGERGRAWRGERGRDRSHRAPTEVEKGAEESDASPGAKRDAAPSKR